MRQRWLFRRKASKSFLIVAGFLLGLSWQVFATTYYVDPASGSDGWNGRYKTAQGGSDGPWKSIPGTEGTSGSGWTRLRGGDVVVVKGGASLFSKIIVNSSYFDSGTSTARVTLQSGHLAGWGTGRAIIDGQQVRGKGFHINGRSYIRIEGFEIRNMRNETASSGIVIEGASVGCQIVDNLIHHIYGALGNSGYGINVSGTTLAAYHLIEKNTVSYVEEKAISIYRQGNCTVRYNSCFRTNEHAMVVSSSNNEIYGNILREAGYDWDGANVMHPAFGFKFDGNSTLQVDNNRLYNNLIYDCNTGIGVLDWVTNSRIFHNTVYYSGFDDLASTGRSEMVGFSLYRDEGGTPSGNQVKNNLFLYSGLWGGQYRVGIYVDKASAGSNNVIDTNLFYQCSTVRVKDAGTYYYLSLADFADGSSSSRRFSSSGSGNSFLRYVNTEPYLQGGTTAALIGSGTLPTGFDTSTWRPDRNGLSPSSATPSSVLKGLVLGAPYNVDITGRARTSFTLGAYELTTTVPSQPPAAPRNLRLIPPSP